VVEVDSLTPSSNACGECNACCHLLEIKGIPDVEIKPSREWCPYVAHGVGCGIYPGRPKACREFQCLWLRLAPIGRVTEASRPDKSGIMITKPNNTSFYIVHMDANAPEDFWLYGEVGELIDRMVHQGKIFLLWRGRGPSQVVRLIDGEVHVAEANTSEPDENGAVNIKWPEGNR
jgi:hypothetical protein